MLHSQGTSSILGVTFHTICVMAIMWTAGFLPYLPPWVGCHVIGLMHQWISNPSIWFLWKSHAISSYGGGEIWALRTSLLFKLGVFLHRSVRIILGIRKAEVKEERIRNAEVRERFFNITTIQNQIAKRQLTFIGKVVRNSDGGDVKEPPPYLCISDSLLLYFCLSYPQNYSYTSVKEYSQLE